MKLFHLAACFLPLVLAQDSSRSVSATSPSAAPSNSTNANQTVITTTITSLVTSGSASPSPTAIVLTLTLNSTASSPSNSSLANSTISANGTVINGTAANATAEWKEGDDWIPFGIPIDPAYGVLGALLILTGIPVAVLGGKNRWSSLAIASGYSLGLFTLVMILRFGVEPSIQPPSPNPPSQTLRGLYLLACIVASIIGGGIGVFLWKLAKYWVSASGGFAFGWFLLALRPGGLITNVLGRWGLLGGLTVGAFVASLPEALNPWTMLLGTAWIGATAFMLGVDCYTRAGLKEFYVHNLGFFDLYPELKGAKYPLTQTMSIELGILGAVIVVGAAIQFRVLNILQKRIKQLKEDEEAREDSAEVSKAAERFKNLETEQTEWEEKYGSGSGSGKGPGSPEIPLDTPNGTSALPQLEFDPRRASSQLSLLSQKEKGRYETSLHSPGLGDMRVPSPDGREVMRDREELASPFAGGARSGSAMGGSIRGDVALGGDDEIESKMKLLDEVRQARLSIRSSLDHLNLRSQTPTVPGAASASTTPTSSHFDPHIRRNSGASSRMLEPTYASVDRPMSRQQSQPTQPQSEWERYTSDRRIISPTLPSPASLGPVDSRRPMSTRQLSHDAIYETPEIDYGADRRDRTTSMLETRTSDFGPHPPHRQSMHDTYPLGEPLRRTESAHATVNPANGMSRPTSSYDLPRQYDTTPHHRLSTLSTGPGVITGSASQAFNGTSRPASMQRTMTYEELADRHRKRISKLQDPVSSKMKEEVALAEAKEKWERQKRAEKVEMRRREAEGMLRQKEGERVTPGPVWGRGDGAKKAEEWRRSVHTDLNMAGQTGQPQRASKGPGQMGQGEQPVGMAGRNSRRMSSHLAN